MTISVSVAMIADLGPGVVDLIGRPPYPPMPSARELAARGRST